MCHALGAGTSTNSPCPCCQSHSSHTTSVHPCIACCDWIPSTCQAPFVHAQRACWMRCRRTAEALGSCVPGRCGSATLLAGLHAVKKIRWLCTRSGGCELVHTGPAARRCRLPRVCKPQSTRHVIVWVTLSAPSLLAYSQRAVACAASVY